MFLPLTIILLFCLRFKSTKQLSTPPSDVQYDTIIYLTTLSSKSTSARSKYELNVQNITCPLVNTNLIFSCSSRFLTSERSERERVRYGLEHSKIKFVSTCGHVISSIIAKLHFFSEKFNEMDLE